MTRETQTGAIERAKARTVDLDLRVTSRNGNRFVGVGGIQHVEPSDINWSGIQQYLTEQVDLTNWGKVGTITVRGVHCASSDIVGFDLDDGVLKAEGYVDLAILRSFGGDGHGD